MSQDRAVKIKLLVFDVEEVLTDGKIWVLPAPSGVRQSTHEEPRRLHLSATTLSIFPSCAGAALPRAVPRRQGRGQTGGAHFTTTHAGGDGALRDAVEYILKAQGTWERVLEEYTSERPKDRVNKLLNWGSRTEEGLNAKWKSR